MPWKQRWRDYPTSSGLLAANSKEIGRASCREGAQTGGEGGRGRRGRGRQQSVGERHKRFFLQAEDGIRDRNVTGVQTCALPICRTAWTHTVVKWCTKLVV